MARGRCFKNCGHLSPACCQRCFSKLDSSVTMATQVPASFSGYSRPLQRHLTHEATDKSLREHLKTQKGVGVLILGHAHRLGCHSGVYCHNRLLYLCPQWSARLSPIFCLAHLEVKETQRVTGNQTPVSSLNKATSLSES